jgi:carbon-monoxide dehydrogenase iron sulfur subunit
MASCISKDKKTGKVDIDTKRCVGCWMCIMVCPFAAITRQYVEENKALKCDLCPDRDSPACVDTCPTKALSYERRKEFAKKQNEILVSNEKT